MKNILIVSYLLLRISGFAQDTPLLVGSFEPDDLLEKPYSEWFNSTFEEYTPNQEIVQQLNPLFKNIRIQLFMGTWCEDSRREVPAFFKIINSLDLTNTEIQYTAVDKDKMTPSGIEQVYGIEYVPTIIFFKGEKEINRIVEFPVISLEEDMLAILNGSEYRNVYDF